MQLLYELSQAAIEQVDTTFVRYMDAILPWENRLTALIGPRGVGKTTLILQHIKNSPQRNRMLYVSAETVYFSENKLFNTAMDFHKNGGIYLFIDEIHKYKGWALELKMIYDNFPKLKVFFTGSSVLDIYSGTADLSRRALVYYMHGMSFREYLNKELNISVPTFTLEQVLQGNVSITERVEYPLVHFKEYLQRGFYPFSTEKGYFLRLNQIVAMTIENDIPTYANVSLGVANKLKHLLQIITDSVPFKPNHSKIAEMIGIDRKQIVGYFNLMERAGLIMQLRDNTKGIRALGKVNKMYLDNTNLLYALSNSTPNVGNMRETFFMNQLRVSHSPFASSVSDFEIDGKTFEIGGKSKGQSQIKDVAEGYVVRDDIEQGFANTLPLWHFGLLY